MRTFKRQLKDLGRTRDLLLPPLMSEQLKLKTN